MDDNTPIYDILFEMEMALCDRFAQFTPLSLRREKAREVFTMIVRFNRYMAKENKRNKRTKDGKRIIRKPAGDNWF